MDDRQKAIKKAHLSFQLRWTKKTDEWRVIRKANLSFQLRWAKKSNRQTTGDKKSSFELSAPVKNGTDTDENKQA
jgi:hypothetical protein